MSQRRRLPTRSQMDAQTPFRKKYGYIAGYESTFQSGLTPTQYLFPGNSTDPRLQRKFEEKERLQRQNLYGWTTRELADLDCLCIRDAKPEDLENAPIMPLLDRPVWEKSPPPDFSRDYMYVLEDNRGEMSMFNPVVWEAMKPVLKIASWYLSSAYMMPFFDALLNGPRTEIPQSRIFVLDRGKGPFCSFRPPDTPTPPDQLAWQMDRVFEDLRVNKKFQLGFMVQNESPLSVDDADWKSNSQLAGFCDVNIEYMNREPREPDATWKIFIFVDSTRLERILKGDLSSSERMSMEWYIALTLSHEVIHALNYRQGIDDGGWTSRSQESHEPYFLDQPISELGWSFEKEINGGVQERMGKRMKKVTHGLDLGNFFLPTWPSDRWKNIRNQGSLVLENPGPSLYDIRYPIPISLMEDLQQQNFWNTGVRAFGIGLLFLRVYKVGTRTTYEYVVQDGEAKALERIPNPPDTKEGETSIRTTINQNLISTVNNLNQMINLSPEQRSIAEFGHGLILSSNRESDFWGESQSKHDNMKKISNLLYNDPRIRTPSQAAAMIFKDILPPALINHENMVTSTLLMENERESLNNERRKHLIAWNKGAASFVRQMVKEVQQTNSKLGIPEAEGFLIKLERQRLRLSNPNPSDDTTDADELLHLLLGKYKQILATTNPSIAEAQQMDTLANIVLGDEDFTIFACACTKILIAVLGSKTADGWNARVAVGGGAAMNSFGALAQTEGDTEEDIGKLWKDEINAWQAMLIEVAKIGPPK